MYYAIADISVRLTNSVFTLKKGANVTVEQIDERRGRVLVRFDTNTIDWVTNEWLQASFTTVAPKPFVENVSKMLDTLVEDKGKVVKTASIGFSERVEVNELFVAKEDVTGPQDIVDALFERAVMGDAND